MNEHDPEQSKIPPSSPEEDSWSPDEETVLPSNPKSAEETPTVLSNTESSSEPAPTMDSAGPSPQDGHPKIQYFGEYELLDEIARGGMGVVYKAKQVKLNRLVALKMILSGQLAGEDDVKRFHTEAEAAANLDHSGIVPIYEVSEHGGQHYFSMAFVEGPSLAAVVANGPLPPNEAAQITKAVTEAMAYAHDRGVIHRDLKPANILLAKVDDKRPTAVYLTVEGIEPGWYEAKVTDFGLAKKTEGDSQLTGTGQILGTPSYMPPEQADGKTDEIGPLADVYSLGAVLYCLLTGRPPFQSDNVIETLTQVLKKEPQRVRQLNSHAPRDLETICHRCLEKQPPKRYQSSAELAAELERFLEDKPIHARPVGFIERGWRWCRRNPVASLVTIAAVFLIGLGAAGIFALQASQENSRKQAESLVAALLTARAEAVPDAIQNLEPLKDYAIPLLEQRLQNLSLPDSQRCHAAFALFRLGQPVDVVVSAIDSTPTEEFANLVATLKTSHESALVALHQAILAADKQEDWDQKARLSLVALWLDDQEPATAMSSSQSLEEYQSFLHTLSDWHKNLSQLEHDTSGSKDELLPFLTKLLDNVDFSVADPATQLQKVYAKELGREVEITNSIGMKMRLIPPGEFLMGSTEEEVADAKEHKLPSWYIGRLPIESPQHKVRITNPFLLSTHEVTRGQFRQFVETTGYKTDAEKDGKGGRGYSKDTGKRIHSPEFLWNTDLGFVQTDDHPVVNVSWNDAVAFAVWLSEKEGIPYRLPTEAEWEFACRAGTKGRWSLPVDTESILESYAWYHYKGGKGTKPVGQKKPNPFGLHDMYGNVWEWCQDWQGSYSAALAVDPTGPAKASDRVDRGGGWNDAGWLCRSAYRGSYEPDDRSSNRGFRLAAVPSRE